MLLGPQLFVFCVAWVGVNGIVYPHGWQNAPGTLGQFRNGNVYNINPWLYSNRLGVYKIMLNQTTFAMKPFGANNSGNILWGLPLQFGWQFASGRTRDFSNQTDCGFTENHDCVSYKSWWASMNYYLSIIPFLGMVKAGYFQVSPSSIRIESPDEDHQLYCTDIASCDKIDPELLSKWSEFFVTLRTVSNESKPNLEDRYLSAMWKAHVQSIATALSLFKDREELMSSQELAFGINWANLVSFIAATHFATSNNNTATFQAYLPWRLLWDSDHAPNVPGLTAYQNKTLIVMKLFYRLNYISVKLLEGSSSKRFCSFDQPSPYPSIFSGMVAVEGLPGRGSRPRLSLPCLNSATLLITVGNEGASSPKVELSLSVADDWFLRAWNRAMCTPEARKIGRTVLETIVPNTLSAIADMIRLIGFALTNVC